MKNLFDVEFTYDTPLKIEVRIYRAISPQMFYHLREKFFKTYGEDKMLSVEVYLHGTDKLVKSFCWYPEEDEEYNNPNAFYARYGW